MIPEFFLPLNKEFYFKFKRGEQDCEIRPSNHRGWNLKNIYPGRQLLLSNGYGNYDRHTRQITAVTVTGDLAGTGIEQWHIEAVENIYGKRDLWLIAYV